MEQWLAEIKLRARRRVGEISASLDASKGGNNPAATLPTGGTSKRAACERAGLNYQSAFACGRIAAKFKSLARAKGLGFKHHRILAIEALTPDQRQHLLTDAATHKWTAKRLVSPCSHDPRVAHRGG